MAQRSHSMGQVCPSSSLTAINRIDELLGLPGPQGFCQGFTSATIAGSLQYRRNSAKKMIARFSCKSWRCRICSARKRLELGRHFATKLLLSGGDLFEEDSDPDRWKSDSQRLRRLGASWVRVAISEETGTVLGSLPKRTGTPFSDPEQAIRRLGQVLSRMVPQWNGPHSKARPVVNSSGWTPPKKASKYELIGWIPKVTNWQAVVAALGELGVTAYPRKGSGDVAWSVAFEIPEGVYWAEVEVALTLRCCLEENQKSISSIVASSDEKKGAI